MPEASAVRSLEKTVHPDCVAWVRDRLQLAEFQPEMWQDTHDETTHNFLTMSNEDTLLAWLHEGKLQLQSKMPNDPPAQLV